MNKHFVKLLDKMREIHDRKSKDYAAESNVYENFERAAIVSSWYKDSVDKVFVTLITVKMARLATLLSSESAPNNESIDDSFLDLTTYCGLWTSYHASKKEVETFAGIPIPFNISGDMLIARHKSLFNYGFNSYASNREYKKGDVLLTYNKMVNMTEDEFNAWLFQNKDKINESSDR